MTEKSVVYFVRIGKHVKIGVTTNLVKRLKAFATSSADIELLATVPGGRELEKRLHESLLDCHVERELFRREHRVIGFIDNFKFGGIDRAFKFLAATDPNAMAKAKAAEHSQRVVEARRTRAEKDAYFASLVSERKSKLGW